MNSRLKEKIVTASVKDPDILCERDKVEETLGSDARYLTEVLGLTKSDLTRLEREGFAVKARYSTQNKKRPYLTGPHRIRWIIFKDVVA